MDIEVNNSSSLSPPEPQTVGAWLRQNGVTLAMMAALVVVVLWKFGLAGLLYGLGVAFGLSVVIFLHELGHFAVAKWCDVHVEAFSIGFGPALPGCSFQKGETTYLIGCIPLGGYVKMLGEGADTDEEDTNPRSFQNKSVPQRMAIISAGVIMNILLGAACFIFVYMTRGERQIIGAIGAVEAGSPAWVKGAQSGDVIYRIDNINDPSYNDLLHKVPLSAEGELDFAFGPPGGPRYVTTIQPRRTADDSRPVIGVTAPGSLDLLPRHLAPPERPGPVFYNSAAARAQPPFQFGDEIVAMTDPRDPTQITELPPNPRNPDTTSRDYFAFRRRLQDLAGRAVTVRVLREQSDGSKRSQDIHLPPAYHHSLGLRLRMGQVVAIRQLPDAPPCPIQHFHRTADGKRVEGDILYALEVTEADGSKTRWVTDRSGEPAAAVIGLAAGNQAAFPLANLALLPALLRPTDEEVLFGKFLDPWRLPTDLKQWDQRTPGSAKQVRVTVKRNLKGDPNHKLTFSLPWEERFRYSNELSQNISSPVSLPELGLAYHVETTIEAVLPDSPAARARLAESDGERPLQKGDVIREVQFYQTEEDGSLGPLERRPKELKQHQGAFLFHMLQVDGLEAKRVKLKIERGDETFDVVLIAQEDPTWPKVDRGLSLMNDQRYKKATTVGEAIGMGWNRTVSFIQMVYLMIRGLVTGRLSVDNVGGPVTIFTTGYGILEYNDLYTFIFFLGAISINLAVINFLPIPVLDGGHFVFLLYEGLRGRPAPKKVLYYTTLTGLMLIGCLMIFVLFLDFKKLLY